MHDFMKSALEWVLDKEEKAAKNHAIADEDIDKQIDILTTKKEKYQRDCEDMLHEFEHLLTRLNAIKEKNQGSA